MRIVLERLKCPIAAQRVEFAERKGIGHPDFICDSICEAASIALSKEYIKRFGAVAHHNIDKSLIAAGVSRPRFGGGSVLEPMKIFIAGRATSSINKEHVDVEGIVKKTVARLLKKYRYLKPEHYVLNTEIKEGAAALKRVFGKVALANDSSFGVSHWPPTRLEALVFKACDRINSRHFLLRFKAVGEDVKVLGIRNGKDIKLVIAIAFVDKFFSSVKEYFEYKQGISEYLEELLGVKVIINALDDTKAHDESSLYLTVTGLSCEHGDDGNAGRSNKVGGLITPNAPMSLESTAGKNINHPGKLYQVVAHIIARKLCELRGIKSCNVKLVSQIGRPLDEPLVVCAQLEGQNQKAVQTILDVLSSVPKIQKQILKERYVLF